MKGYPILSYIVHGMGLSIEFPISHGLKTLILSTKTNATNATIFWESPFVEQNQILVQNY